jgi:hypothetical protein
MNHYQFLEVVYLLVIASVGATVLVARWWPDA